jgi:hypothetical protein
MVATSWSLRSISKAELDRDDQNASFGLGREKKLVIAPDRARGMREGIGNDAFTPGFGCPLLPNLVHG